MLCDAAPSYARIFLIPVNPPHHRPSVRVRGSLAQSPPPPSSPPHPSLWHFQLVVPDESPARDRPEEERVPARLGALDEVSLEADEKTELERERQVQPSPLFERRNRFFFVFRGVFHAETRLLDPTLPKTHALRRVLPPGHPDSDKNSRPIFKWGVGLRWAFRQRGRPLRCKQVYVRPAGGRFFSAFFFFSRLPAGAPCVACCCRRCYDPLLP